MLRPLATLLSLGLYLTSLCDALALSAEKYTDKFVTNFLTEPRIQAPALLIKEWNENATLAPGYIFITPYGIDWKFYNWGPLIFAEDGTLIWFGNDSASVRAMDAHVCDYLGSKGSHICFNDASPIEQGGHSAGVIRFLDNTYTAIHHVFGAVADLRGPDAHELNAVEDGRSLLQDVYQVKRADLTPYLGPKQGYVLDACFQEVSVRDRKVVFQWCAMDHIPLWDTYIYLEHKEWAVNSRNATHWIAGLGDADRPWDYFHINSIDKNREGDYLISGRHMDAVYKIAGRNNVLGKQPGDIVWHFSGRRNDFKMVDRLNISRQHTARFVETNTDTELFSVFDNADDGLVHTAQYSIGKLIAVNNITMEARVVREYPHPGRHLSPSQGSMQVLGNKNVFMGWGDRPEFSEHAEDGAVLYWAEYSLGPNSLRAWKHPWRGFPRTRPKVLAYAKTCSGTPMYGYVSWNGATEVAAWAVYGSSFATRGPWQKLGVWPKTGFETMLNFSDAARSRFQGFVPRVYVDALDARGGVLGSSGAVQTFTPGAAVARFCDATHCVELERFGYERKHSGWARCAAPRPEPGLAVVLLLLCAWELLERLVCGLLVASGRGSSRGARAHRASKDKERLQ